MACWLSAVMLLSDSLFFDLFRRHLLSWIEKNFHEIGPVNEKIGFGYRDDYMVAKEKTKEDMSSEVQMMQLLYDGNGNELEWMHDETLREIVFKVRDNELSKFVIMNCREKTPFI